MEVKFSGRTRGTGRHVVTTVDDAVPPVAAGGGTGVVGVSGLRSSTGGTGEKELALAPTGRTLGTEFSLATTGK